MNFFEKLDSLQNLTPNEESLITFILKEPNRFMELKPKDIAVEAYVSLSTIYRFADKLGLDGVNAMKVELASALMQNNVGHDLNIAIDLNGSPLQLIGRMKENLVQSVQNTYADFSPNLLHQISDLVRDAEGITVFTSYSNYFFAQNFKYQMSEVGKRIAVPRDMYSCLSEAAVMESKDLAVIISQDGRSSSMQTIAKKLSDKNVNIIVITRNPENPIVSHATATMIVHSKYTEDTMMEGMFFRQGMYYCLNTLFVLYLRAHSDSIDLRRKEIESVLSSGSNDDISPDLY